MCFFNDCMHVWVNIEMSSPHKFSPLISSLLSTLSSSFLTTENHQLPEDISPQSLDDIYSLLSSHLDIISHLIQCGFVGQEKTNNSSHRHRNIKSNNMSGGISSSFSSSSQQLHDDDNVDEVGLVKIGEVVSELIRRHANVIVFSRLLKR